MKDGRIIINRYVALGIILCVLLISNHVANELRLLIYLGGFVVGFFSVPYGTVAYFLFYTKLFGLYSNETIGSSNVISFADAAFFTALGMIISFVVRRKFALKINIIKKQIPILFLIICMLSSVLVAYLRWGQPVVKSLITFRHYFTFLIVYPIYMWIIEDKEKNGKLLIDIFSSIATFVCVIFIVQYFVFPNHLVLQIVATDSNRMMLSNIRYLLHSCSQWMCFLCVYNYYMFRKSNTKSGKSERFLSFLILFITIVFITQTRIFYVSLFVLLIVIEVSIYKGKSKLLRKILTFLLIGFCMLEMYWILFPEGSASFLSLFEQTESGTRTRAITFFSDTIKGKNVFWGGGITNTAYANSPAAMAQKYRISLSDLGFWGFYYQFGVQSCLAIVLLFITNLKKSRNCNTDIYNMIGLYTLMVIMQMLTVIPDYSLLVILTAIISGNMKSDERMEQISYLKY